MYGGLRPLHMGEPRNIAFGGMSNSITDFVGAKASDPSDGEIQYNTRMILEKARANKRRLVSLLTHDLKSGGDASYDDGIDQDELGSVLFAVDSVPGAVYMTYGEAILWIKGKATLMATPPAYAQPDTFEFAIEDRVWGRLNAMDDSFIPGVK